MSKGLASFPSKPMKTPITLLLLLSAPFLKAAVSVPYQNDFSVGAADFTTTTPGQWAVSGGGFVNSISGDGPSAATVEVTRPANSNFTMQATFNLGASTTATSYGIGFAALGTGAATTGAVAGVNFYLADVSNLGAIRILQFTGGANTVIVADTAATGASLGSILTSETYTMTLQGTYIGSALTLALTVFDGTNTRTVTSSSIAAPLTGNYFGFRDRDNNAGTVFSVTADNFSIVPEPASVALAGLGLGVLAIRRRRA